MGVGRGCTSKDGTHNFVLERYDDPGAGNGPQVAVMRCSHCGLVSKHEVGPSV